MEIRPRGSSRVLRPCFVAKEDKKKEERKHPFLRLGILGFVEAPNTAQRHGSSMRNGFE